MMYSNISTYYSAAFTEHCNAPASWVQAALAYNTTSAENLHDSTCDSYTNNAARVDEERAAVEESARAAEMERARRLNEYTAVTEIEHITSAFAAVYSAVAAPLLHIHFDRAIVRRVWLQTCAARTLARPLPNTQTAAARVAEVRPRALFVQTAAGKYSRVEVQGPGMLKPVHDTPEYSRPRAIAPAQTAIYIPKNHAGIMTGSSVPAPEYNTSVAAKNAVQVRQYGNVQSLAIRATISAVKLAIAPRARFINTMVIDEITAIIDGNAVNIETLEDAADDVRGSYTATLKNALASLQKYAHSAVDAYPENSDAAELLSIATLAILERSRVLGVDAEEYATGYHSDGTPFVRVIDGAQGGARNNVGNILIGYRAVFAHTTAAVNSAIRGEKTRFDGKISIDALSMASDTTAPEKWDVPDVYSMDAAAAWELSDSIRAAILASTKKPDIAARRVRIAGYLSAGYLQPEIADLEQCAQSTVAKDVAVIRDALTNFDHSAAAVGYSAYKKSYEDAKKAAKDSGKKWDVAAMQDSRRAAEKAARSAVFAMTNK